MSKRKRQPRTTGEGLHPPKPPKNPRLIGAPGSPQSSELGPLHQPTGSEDNSGPTASAELGREEPGQTVSSFPAEETAAASSLLGTPEQEPASQLPSQTSVRRFVPQFAKPKKTVTRKAEAREEDPERGAVHWEASPELDVLKAGNQLLEESLGLPLREATRPEDQMQEAGAIPEQSGQSSATPVPNHGHGHAGSEVALEGDPEPSDSRGASQEPPLGVRVIGSNGPETQMAWVPGSLGQEKPLHWAEAEEKEPGSRGPQEEGAGSEQPGAGSQEEGDDVPYIPKLASASAPDTPCLTGTMAQHVPVPTQPHSTAGWEADLSSSSPACTSPGDSVIADMNLDPSELQLQHRAVEVAVPSGHVPAGGCCTELPLDCTHLAQETRAGREETGREEESSDGDPAQPRDQKATELGRQSCEHDLKVVHTPHASLLEHSYAASSPPQGSPGLPVYPARVQVPDSSDESTWPDSSAMELELLPDSQMQHALDAPDLEAPPEQNLPAGSEPDLDWPDPSSRAIRGDLSSLTKAQFRPHACAPKAPKACRMQDATDTVRGLIVELSNLNRLIMATHRDLEAFKRRKAKLPSKAPVPTCRRGWGPSPEGSRAGRTCDA